MDLAVRQQEIRSGLRLPKKFRAGYPFKRPAQYERACATKELSAAKFACGVILTHIRLPDLPTYITSKAVESRYGFVEQIDSVACPGAATACAATL
jgi:hypothetical protein